jgi:hypothetical protein
MKKKWIVLGVAAAVVGAGAYLLVSRGVPVAKVAELASEEGELRLRDTLRAARGGPRVLVFALDGVGHDELTAAVRSGRAPHILSVLGEEVGDGIYANAYAAPEAMSILPSTTLAAWASVFTGQPAAFTGIPGNEFFVREQRRFYAPAPVTIEDVGDMVRSFSDDLMGTVLAVPTLYEQSNVLSYVALSHIHRGADLLIIPDISSMGEIVLSAVTGVADKGDPESEEYGELDGEAADVVLESMHTHGIPDLQVIYFPGVDLFTHVAKDPIADQRLYVTEVIDPAVGAVLAAYRAAGALDDTYVIFVSDHGHTPVLDDDRHALGSEGDDEPPAVLERVGFRMRALTLEPGDDEQDYQATMAFQGAFAYLYLADRSTCAQPGQHCDWSRAPRLEQDVLPVVRAFDEANRTGAHVPALRGTLDLILARDPRAPGTDALPFQVWDGSRLVDIEAYLARNPRPDLVRFAERMNGLSAGPHGHRAGDVLLFARSGASRPIEERFYFSGIYRSWHGSPDRQDSHVPLILARPGVNGTALRERMQRITGDAPTQLHVVPLVLDLLAGR